MRAEKAANALLIAGSVAMALVVGWLTHEDAKAELAFYCEMVGAKSWPDYKGTFKKECVTVEENFASTVDFQNR